MDNTRVEGLQDLVRLLLGRFDKIDDKLDRMAKVKQCLDNDELLDNQDMCTLLGITKRTLQRYWQKKIITYYMIDGKTYYKKSELMGFFSQRGKKLP